MTQAEVSKAVETPTVYELGKTFEEVWTEFQKRKRRIAADTAWCEEFQKRMDALSGGAEAYTLNGIEVATYKPTQRVNVSLVGKERPDLKQRYTRIVARETFDSDAFKQEMPDEYDLFRVRAWNMKTPKTEQPEIN